MHYLIIFFFFDSTKSYGSHEHDPYDSESHRGSKRSLHNAKNEKDPSKEDIEINENSEFVYYIEMFIFNILI